MVCNPPRVRTWTPPVGPPAVEVALVGFDVPRDLREEGDVECILVDEAGREQSQVPDSQKMFTLH